MIDDPNIIHTKRDLSMYDLDVELIVDDDDEGGGGEDREPIEGRIIKVVYIRQADDTPEDGQSEFEDKPLIFNCKLIIKTPSKNTDEDDRKLPDLEIAVAGSVSTNSALVGKRVRIYGGEWGTDGYHARMLLHAAIIVAKPKTAEKVISTREGFTPSQIEKFFDAFGEEKVIATVNADKNCAASIPKIADVTRIKLIGVCDANRAVPLDVLSILAGAGIRGCDALKLIKRQAFKTISVPVLANTGNYPPAKPGALRCEPLKAA